MSHRKIFPVLAAFLLLGAVSAPGLSAQDVYDVSQLTDKPSIASPMAAQRAIQRAYPESLHAAGVEGKVILQFVVTPDGTVDASTIVVQSTENAKLADAAKAAIARIEFVPGAVDGATVATRVVFPISFVAE